MSSNRAREQIIGLKRSRCASESALAPFSRTVSLAPAGKFISARSERIEPISSITQSMSPMAAVSKLSFFGQETLIRRSLRVPVLFHSSLVINGINGCKITRIRFKTQANAARVSAFSSSLLPYKIGLIISIYQSQNAPQTNW